MKYAIIAAIVLAAYSFSRCYSFLTRGEAVGLLQTAYCRVTFLHFTGRSFSPFDFVVHLFFWIMIGILAWRAYIKYLKGRLF